MFAAVTLFCVGLAALSLAPDEAAAGMLPTSTIAGIMLAFFLMSVAISLISVIAGIGGGVIFTPIMLAFTGVNSLVVRGAGVIVAMFSGLISTGVFLRKGIGNYRLMLVMTLCQGLGALLGSTLAVMASGNAGSTGEGWMRVSLGALLLMMAVYFVVGGKKSEWPVVCRVDRITRMLRLNGMYREATDGSMRAYCVTRAPLGMLLIFAAGMIGGFFGMGGGWAITPALNLGMAVPLKLAAANAHMILGIGNCVSIWPYIAAGGIIPLFILPLLAGQVIGGFIGAYALARIRAGIVRLILIGVMAFTAFGLVTKGLEIVGLIPSIPAAVQVFVLAAVLCCMSAVALVQGKRSKEANAVGTSGRAAESTLSPSACGIPLSQSVFAGITHWVTIAVSITALLLCIGILATPASNMLHPNQVFSAIFDGAAPSRIWALSAGGSFPGVHPYLQYAGSTDAWGQLVINIGCTVGLLATIPAVLIQICRERDWFAAALGIGLSLLILCAMTGVI